MSSREIARQWFIQGDGIDRHVISADIQRYLGNDATVRPGVGNGDHEGVQGYWIKAYRNLTSAMIADLRADSARWRQEQRVTGTREPYVGSSTYHASSAGRPDRRHGDSPSVEGPYGVPSTRDRLPTNRVPTDRRMPQSDAMDIDPPSVSQPDRRYGQPDRGFQPESRAYPAESRAYPPESRAYAPESRPSYQQEQPMPSNYGRTPVTSSYNQESRYAPSYPQTNDGAPPGYVRQGNYYVPVSTYEPAPAMPPSRSEPPQYPNGPYGQPSAQGRDTREPRYGGQPDYTDPRYAYPSPAATTVSVSGRDREPVTSPPQPSAYAGSMSSHLDQYGRPVMSPSAQQERSMPSARDRDPAFGRERERNAVSSSSGEGHRNSRRRVQ